MPRGGQVLRGEDTDLSHVILLCESRPDHTFAVANSQMVTAVHESRGGYFGSWRSLLNCSQLIEEGPLPGGQMSLSPDAMPLSHGHWSAQPSLEALQGSWEHSLLTPVMGTLQALRSGPGGDVSDFCFRQILRLELLKKRDRHGEVTGGFSAPSLRRKNYVFVESPPVF